MLRVLGEVRKAASTGGSRTSGTDLGVSCFQVWHMGQAGACLETEAIVRDATRFTVAKATGVLSVCSEVLPQQQAGRLDRVQVTATHRQSSCTHIAAGPEEVQTLHCPQEKAGPGDWT